MKLNRFQKQVIDNYSLKNLSVAQIASNLNVSLAKVRYCLKKFEVPKRSISEAITSLNITKFNKIPFVPKRNLSFEERELRVAGIMLYWGEGAKTGGVVKFANSDPVMIKVFLKFLREICGIHEERLKALIHLYPDHDQSKIEKFWSGVAKIPLTRFNKSHIHLGKKGTYRNKSMYGTICINYSDKRLLKTILEWIEEYKTKVSPS